MEHAEGSIVIDAPLEDIMEVIEGYESYPEWADVRTVEVLQRGEGGPLEKTRVGRGSDASGFGHERDREVNVHRAPVYRDAYCAPKALWTRRDHPGRVTGLLAQ